MSTHDTTTEALLAVPQPPRTLLTVDQVCAQLKIGRGTLYRWWEKGAGPRRIQLPGGGIRVRQEHLDQFIDRLEVAA